MGPKEIKLSEPIQVDGEAVHVLTLQPIKVRHLRVIDEAKGEIDQSRRLIAALAGVPPSSLDDMAGEDFLRCAGEVAAFLGVSPLTGKT